MPAGSRHATPCSDLPTAPQAVVAPRGSSDHSGERTHANPIKSGTGDRYLFLLNETKQLICIASPNSSFPAIPLLHGHVKLAS